MAGAALSDYWMPHKHQKKATNKTVWAAKEGEPRKR